MNKETFDKLNRLAELYDQGILTPNEMREEKRKILGEVGKTQIFKEKRNTSQKTDKLKDSPERNKRLILFVGIGLVLIVGLCIFFYFQNFKILTQEENSENIEESSAHYLNILEDIAKDCDIIVGEIYDDVHYIVYREMGITWYWDFDSDPVHIAPYSKKFTVRSLKVNEQNGKVYITDRPDKTESEIVSALQNRNKLRTIGEWIYSGNYLVRFGPNPLAFRFEDGVMHLEEITKKGKNRVTNNPSIVTDSDYTTSIHLEYRSFWIDSLGDRMCDRADSRNDLAYEKSWHLMRGGIPFKWEGIITPTGDILMDDNLGIGDEIRIPIRSLGTEDEISYIDRFLSIEDEELKKELMNSN